MNINLCIGVCHIFSIYYETPTAFWLLFGAFVSIDMYALRAMILFSLIPFIS
jgi:hypothetical protein